MSWDVDKNTRNVQEDFTNWLHSCPVTAKDASDTMSCLQKFLLSHSKRERSTRTMQQSLSKLVKFYSGIVTQALHITQKRQECQKEPSQSERRNSNRTRSAKWITRRMVGTVRWNAVVNCEMSGRWQDNTREKFWEQFEGPPIFFWTLFDYIPITTKRRVNTSSVWIEHFERHLLRLCTTCGKRVIRRLTGSRFWRFARLRSLRNRRQKDSNAKTHPYNEFPFANGTLKLLDRQRPSSKAEGRLEQEAGLEIAEGDKRLRYERFVVFELGIYFVDTMESPKQVCTTQEMIQSRSHWNHTSTNNLSGKIYMTCGRKHRT